MTKPYLPTWATAQEAAEWLHAETGERWPLPRLVESGADMGVWLDCADDAPADMVANVFQGRREGFMASLMFGGDSNRLAAVRDGGTLTMTRRPDGELLRRTPPARFAAADVRFAAASVREIARAVDEARATSEPVSWGAFNRGESGGAMFELVLLAGTKDVPVKEIPERLALAIHPVPPEDHNALGAEILRIDAEKQHRDYLREALRLGQLVAINHARLPSAGYPHDRVPVDGLRAYAAQFGVVVRIATLAAAEPVPGVVAAAPVVLAAAVPSVVASAKASKATQAANKVARQDGRLSECEAQGMVFDKASLLRLPDGIGKVAQGLGIERQSLTTDVKAALQRRFETARNGKG